MSEVFNVDEMAGNYKPVEIEFRGVRYELGSTVQQLILCTEMFSGGDSVGAGEIFSKLPALLRTLNPELEPIIKDAPFTAGEELALVNVVTEVLSRFTAMTKSAETARRGDSPVDGS